MATSVAKDRVSRVPSVIWLPLSRCVCVCFSSSKQGVIMEKGSLHCNSKEVQTNSLTQRQNVIWRETDSRNPHQILAALLQH